MRVLLLLLAVGLAATQYVPDYREFRDSRESRESGESREWVESDIAWREGTELEFKYDSQILTGVPTTSTQYSGLKVTCRVKTQLIPNNKVLMKLSDIKILVVNDIISSVPPTEPVPESIFNRLEGPEAEELIDNLKIPISFTTENGYITEVEATEDEPYFTVNIKKGIINLFQVNLDQRTHMQDRTVRPVDYMDYSRQFTESKDNSFRVMEPGTCGTCESIYTLIPHIPTSSGPPLMMLNKVRNYLNCLKKPVWESGILAGIGYPVKIAKQMEKPLLKAFTHIDYVLAGERKDFVIKKALASSKFVFNPYEETTGSATTFILQELDLMKIDSTPSDISVSTPLKPLPEGLLMAIPNPISHPEPRPEPNMPNVRSRVLDANRIAQVENLIEEVITKSESTLDWTVPEVTTKLIYALSECNIEELIKICQKYITPSTPWMDKRKELLLGVLPTLSNPAVAPTITKLIQEDLTGMPNWRPGMLLTQMSLTVPPSPTVIRSLLTLCKDTRIRKDVSVWRPAMLGLGTVTYKLAKMCDKLELPKGLCVPAISKVVQTLEEMFDEERNEEPLTMQEKLTILKTIGNTGLPDFIPMLRTILESNKGPKPVHTQTIYALRRIAPRVPRTVQNVLLPIFLDPRRSEYERIAAFVVLMDTQPTFGVLQVITHSLNTEVSLQVGSFVYSYLRTIATSENPVLWKLSRNVRMCLIAARPISVGMTYSKAYHLEIYSELSKYGAGLETYLINSPSTIIPKTIVTKLNLTMAGINTEIVEFGIDTEGLDTLARRLVGPYGILGDIIDKKSPIIEAFEPHLKPLWGSVGEDMQRILRKISIKERPEEEFRGMMHMKLFGSEIRHLVVDRDLIRNIKKTGISLMETLLSGRKEVDLLQVLPSGESSLLLPTPIGIPVTLNVSAIAMLRLKGSIEVTGLPTIQSLLTGRISPDEIKLNTNLITSGLVQVKSKLGCVLPQIATGTMMRYRMLGKKPLKLEAGLNLRDVKFSLTYAPPTEEVELFRKEFLPATFVRTIPKIPSPEYCEFDTREITNKTILTEVPLNYNIVSPLLDTKIKVSCKESKRLATYAPYWPLTGRSECRYTLLPRRESAKIVTIDFFKKTDTTPSTRRQQRESEESWFNGWFGDRDSSEEERDLPRRWSSGRNSPSYPKSVIPDTLLGSDPMNLVLEMVTKTDTEKYYKAKLNLMCKPNKKVMQFNFQVVGEPFVCYEETVNANRVVMIDFLVNYIPLEKMYYRDTKTESLYRKNELERLESGELITKLKIDLGLTSLTENQLTFTLLTDIPKSVPVHWTMTARPEVDVNTFTSEIHLKLERPEVIDPLLVGTTFTLVDYFRQYHDITINTTYIPSLPRPIIGKLTTKIHVAPELQRAVVYLKTPVGIDKEIMVPLRLPRIAEPMTLSVEPALNIKPVIPLKKTRPMFSGECKVNDDNKVETYDSVHYPVPQLSPECEVLLTQDCSPQKTFTILTTLPRETRNRKIKVLIPMYRIEVEPEGREKRVTVNDETIPLTNSEPYTIRERSERSRVEVELKKENDKVIINCKKLGLVVIVEPEEITVHTPTTMRSKTCGLCGDFNGETHHEYQGPDMTIFKKSEDFVRRYTIPSRNCEVHSHGRDSTESGSRSNTIETNTCKPKRMTIMRPREHRGIPQSCFSMEPVHVCRGPCKTVGIRSELVSFHCQPTEDDSTKRLEKKMRRTVLNEMEDKPKHGDSYMRDYVNTQKECMPH